MCSQNVEKIQIFEKGLVYGFGQILEFFPTFYFMQNRSEKCVLRYSRKKKTRF